MGVRDELEQCTGFEWDEGNAGKNWQAHRVTDGESEEIFFNHALVVQADTRHSAKETRYMALGRTDAGRCLFVAFTLRGRLIRVISARDMTRRELQVYNS